MSHPEFLGWLMLFLGVNGIMQVQRTSNICNHLIISCTQVQRTVTMVLI